MLKKLTVCLIAVLSSVSALAAHADETALPTASGLNLTVPQQQGSWTFGAEANYFEPNNDFNYAFSEYSTVDSTGVVTTRDTHTYVANANYSWGWGADVTYHLPGHGRDVTLAFTQLNSSDSDSVVSPDSATVIYPTVNGRDTTVSQINPMNAALGQVTTDYDAADLSFGQMIAVGSRVNLHPFAGVRYAYLNYNAIGQYTNTNLSTNQLTSSAEQTLQSKFQGAGPRLGSDAEMHLGGGFSLRTTLGGSLIIGSMDISDTYNNTAYKDGVVSSDINNYHTVDNNTRVVPEVDAKLSAMYRKNFSSDYDLGLELGWQVTEYIDGIQNNTLDDTLATSSQYTNFFMQGPYARIQLDVT